MTGLAQAIKFKYNGDIFTETHAQEINAEKDKIIIKTSDGFKLTANSAVLSTNAPIVDDVSKIYDKQQAFRTYVIAVTIEKNSIPRGLYWDTGNQRSKEAVKPYHYVRTQKDWDDNHDLLIVGGEDHKTGSITGKKELEKRFQRLDNWMRNRFPVIGPIVYRWSGQVMESNDGLAFIGLNPGPNKNIYISTGDSGNGITHGTLAGIILSDLIMGKKNDWIDLYSPSRTVSTSKT
jgi:glycine/D-amino acid oxidase-like deaminating enzyme